ncbi:MAG: DUF1343 domain-containing protein [Gemmatimonadota bacterium]
MIELGCERLFGDAFNLVASRRVGLITNHSGVNCRAESTADRLHQMAGTELAALFGPEHGIRGDAEDGVAVSGERDRRTGVVVHSLYGERRRPEPDQLAGLDVVVFDIQDVGARFYTYLYTMSLAMEAAAAAGIPFVVLDRPNPIGGEEVEGNVLDPAFASFVGLYPIPVRYGLTVGELARLLNAVYGIGADLEVVPMRGWRRQLYWDETGLPWVAPSPNMPAPSTAVVYPGMCFFEGTNVSEGRGTTRPFEQVGAPYIDAFRLADHLNGLAIPGALFRPVFFRPAFAKHAGEACQGIQLHVSDRRTFRPVAAGLEALAAVRRLWPDEFAWHVPSAGIHNFDRLAGTDQVRLALDAGVPVAELESEWARQRQSFLEQRRDYLLYH